MNSMICKLTKNQLFKIKSCVETRIFPCLAIGLLIILFSSNIHVARSQNNAHSSEFTAFIDQVKEIYCKANSFDFDEIRQKYPEVFASILGHALHDQMIFAQKNTALQPTYDRLRQDVRKYLFETVQTCKYQDTDGRPIDGELLWSIAREAAEGLKDKAIQEDFHVGHNSASSVLSENTSSDNSGQSLGKAPITKKPENAITLLGVVAPRVVTKPLVIIDFGNYKKEK
jgi:hypothetical protein